MMTESLFDGFEDDLRDGLQIGVMEVRRSIRLYFQQPRRKIALILLTLIFGSVVLFGGIPIAYSVGETIRIEQRFPLLTAARQLLTVFVLVLIALFLSRTIEQLSHIDSEELMLTTTTPRAVVIGLLSAEVVRFLMWLGIPILLMFSAFAIGMQSVALLVTVPLILVPIVAFAAVSGYVLGIAVLSIARHLPIPSQIKTIGYILVFVVVLVGSQVVPRLVLSNDLPFSLAPIENALLVSPFAAYADFLLIGTPIARPISLSAVLVLVGLIVSVPIGFTVASRLSTRFWMTEPAHSHVRGPEDSEAEMTSTRVPRPFAWWKSGRIAWQYLRRGARSPQQFVHLAIVLIAIAPAISSLFTGSTGSNIVYIFVLGGSIVIGAVLAGAAFGLNPFGDEQTTMPLLLVTTTPPRQFIRGRIVAGLVVSVPFVVVVPCVVAVVGPQSALAVFVYVLVGSGLAVMSAAWAVGLGTAYPKYESQKMMGVDSVTPSYLILSSHNLAVSIVGLIVLVLTGFSLLSLSHGSSISGLYIGGAVVCVVILAASAIGAYVYAVRRFRSHTLDCRHSSNTFI
jgi:ABC-2 type transport system permease protein